MYFHNYVSITFLIISGNRCLGGNYLFWLPMCSKSIKIGMMDAGLELARRGHNITVVSPFKSKQETPGVTEIINKSTFQKLQDEISDQALIKPVTGIPIGKMTQISLDDNKAALYDQEVLKFFKQQKMDVLVTFPLFFGNEAGYYLAHKYNASLVVFSTVIFGLPHINWAIGEPYNPSYTPMGFTGFSQDMNFYQRLINTLATGISSLVVNWYARPKTESMLAEVFPEDQEIPKLSSLAEEIGLFVTHGSPFLGDGLRPVTPKSVMGAMMTCAPSGPLPDHLRTFVENAEHGIIYVSFGSVIKAFKMPEIKRRMMLSVFSKLKQKVIWKWEMEMPDAPPNVMISSWLPQPDLLAHPNVKLFITHGGAGSFQETICHKTPLVGIPISADQFLNINQGVRKGIGLSVKWHDITEDNLANTIEQVLSNPAYNEAVIKLNNLLMDQPEHPLDKVVWWMEYLLRHPGNKDLKNPVLDLYWYQYFLLDIILIVLLLVVTLFMIFSYGMKFVYTKLCSGRKSKKE